MKRNKLLVLLSVLIFVAFLQSCEPSRYVPSAVNIPLHTNKGELQVNAWTGTSNDFQVSYAFSDKLAVMGNFMFISKDSVEYPDWTWDQSSYYDINRLSFDLAVGRYTTFSTNGRFEIYSGFGYGQANFTNLTRNFDEKNSLYKFFLQPNIGVTTPYFDMGMSLRMSGLYIISQAPSSTEKAFIAYFEPVVMSRLGYKYGFLTWQMGLSIPNEVQSTAVAFGTSPIFNIGLQIKLWKIYTETSR